MENDKSGYKQTGYLSSQIPEENLESPLVVRVTNDYYTEKSRVHKYNIDDGDRQVTFYAWHQDDTYTWAPSVKRQLGWSRETWR